MVKQHYSPPPPPGPSPQNRQIREFKMQREHKKSSRFSKQINNFPPASHFLVHFFAPFFFFFYADYHVKLSFFWAHCFLTSKNSGRGSSPPPPPCPSPCYGPDMDTQSSHFYSLSYLLSKQISPDTISMLTSSHLKGPTNQLDNSLYNHSFVNFMSTTQSKN